MSDQASTAARHAIDTVSAAAIGASLMGWLSPLAAFFGACWYAIQIYGWFEARAKKRAQAEPPNIA